jgi:hypothetical protein
MKSTQTLCAFAALALLAGALNAQVIITEYCNDPWLAAMSLGLDTNADGVAATSAQQANDEFVEIVNVGASTVNIGSWTLSDGILVRHTFTPGSFIQPGGCIVVFGGGNTITFNTLGGGFGVIADTGTLGLTNGTDSVTLKDNLGVVVDTYTYGNAPSFDYGDGESVTRNPELAGSPFVKQTTLNGGVFRHSAGLQNDGTSPWLPGFIAPPPGGMYPGNGSDVGTTLSINGQFDNQANGVHNVPAGSICGIQVRSPNQTLVGVPFILAAYAFITGNPPSALQLPGDPAGSIWLVPSATTILVDGISFQGQILAPVLYSNGFLFTGAIPPALAGFGLSVMVQAIAVDPGHNAVNLGVSDARELVIL